MNLPYRLSKADIITALISRDAKTLREISKIFYSFSGIYQRICNYFAYLYRYDWYVSPEILIDNYNKDKAIKDFNRILDYLDKSYIKKTCGKIALDVIIEGVYYCYLMPCKEHLELQKLPADYCRSRFFKDGMPVIEFNVAFFDTLNDINYRAKVLKLFPPEIQKAYIQYRKAKLKSFEGYVYNSWYMLTPGSAFKFTVNYSELPMFASAIPAILDLDAAQDLDRKKQMQKLLKIIVQKLPLDKNGDLIFDVDEARDIHTNAVKMLSKAIGVDVLTTFADIEAIDTSDKNTTTTTDDLEKVERTVFNAFGTSNNLFNTDGNLSLTLSILNDESAARGLLLQFAQFFDVVVRYLNNSKQYNYKLYMLETTQYNYKELAKIYKEQIQYGYSKMLPQIALGHSQSFILSTARFENEVLNLNSLMLPPLSSNTMSAEDLIALGVTSGVNPDKTATKTNEKTTTTTTKTTEPQEKKETGRPAKADSEKSDKTLANEASKG